MDKRIRELALMGLLSALLVIATVMLRFPVPTFNLYFNLGEAIIYLTALLYGPIPGALIGGVGSALADIIGGYPVWAPITFIIKGLEGYIVGSLANKNRYIAVMSGAIIMMAGYALAAGIFTELELCQLSLPEILYRYRQGQLFLCFCTADLNVFL